MARDPERTFYQEVKWTPEAVRRFWDYYGTNPAAENHSFSRRFGRRILRIVLRGARVRGPVVDLGCGPGLPREAWDALVAEVARVLQPGGRFVRTTPNQEDLGSRKVACPECGSVFHRVQHLESIDGATLRALLARHGLVTRLVRATNFRHFPDRVLGRMLEAILRAFHRLDARTAPHLIAVAERPR